MLMRLDCWRWVLVQNHPIGIVSEPNYTAIQEDADIHIQNEELLLRNTYLNS